MGMAATAFTALVLSGLGFLPLAVDVVQVACQLGFALGSPGSVAEVLTVRSGALAGE
jgi:hypothetical protein